MQLYHPLIHQLNSSFVINILVMGTGKDSLIAEGGVKKLGGVVIESRRARSDRNAAEFYGYPYFTFYLEEIVGTHNSTALLYIVALYIMKEGLEHLMSGS